MYRVEDKYACSLEQAFLIQKKLETIMAPDGNQQDENGYRISSIYVDTFDDRCLKEAQEGISLRKKYRIRIYNAHRMASGA